MKTGLMILGYFVVWIAVLILVSLRGWR